MVLKKTKFLPMIFVVLAVAISCFGFDSKKMANKKELPDSKGFAVIELFTSEGCSSCPPADALAGKILGENKQDRI